MPSIVKPQLHRFCMSKLDYAPNWHDNSPGNASTRQYVQVELYTVMPGTGLQLYSVCNWSDYKYYGMSAPDI